METYAPEIERAAAEEANKRLLEEQEAANENEIINDQYESLIRETNPVNEGKNGVIFRVGPESVPQQLRHQLHIENDQALKILKIYASGKAEREFTAQQMAYDLVESNRESNPDIGYVPKPVDFRKLKIKQNTKDQLNRDMHASISGDEAEVLMMDYVENGEDLATVLYKWVADHPPAGKEYITHGGRFDQLQDAVALMLDFNRPSLKGSEADRKMQERLVANDNAEKLYRHLKRTGFVLNPNVIRQIKATMKLFEDNGLYHNDNHERNFMVEGDYQSPDSKDVKVYVIDYGSSTINQKPDDVLSFSLDKQLEVLTPDAERKREQREQEEMRKWANKYTPEQVRKREETLRQLLAEEAEFMRQLNLEGVMATSSESDTEKFLGRIHNDMLYDFLTFDQGMGVVEHMRDSMRMPVYKHKKLVGHKVTNQAVYNKIQKFIKSFNA